MYQFSKTKINKSPCIPLHTDDEDILPIKIYYVADNVTLLCVENNKYVMRILHVGDIIKFNQREHHGILPLHIAENIVTSQSLDRYFEWLYNYNRKLCDAVIEWEFL